MSLLKRLEGVFFNPRPMFEGLAEKPRWIDALIVMMILLIAFSYIVSPYTQKDNLQIWKDNAASLKERMGEDRYNQRLENLENPSQAGQIIQTSVAIPVFFLAALLFQSLMLLVFGRFFSTEGSFKLVFTAYIHANFIDKLLGNAVRLVLALTRKSLMQTSTGLALFFPKLEVTSTAYIILAQVDFFQLWMFGIMGYALSAIFKIDLKKALIISYAFWFLKALVNASIAILGMSLMG